ncbi:hypothetical protein AB0D54_32315 [Streptomyces xanthophaeus]|uniref:hypothetical protein n=1 Tax=Streptomyces xanthophaeus TaxID=67385 RepID=UPI003422DED8
MEEATRRPSTVRACGSMSTTVSGKWVPRSQLRVHHEGPIISGRYRLIDSECGISQR